MLLEEEGPAIVGWLANNPIVDNSFQFHYYLKTIFNIKSILRARNDAHAVARRARRAGASRVVSSR
jgi:hypothetical protein